MLQSYNDTFKKIRLPNPKNTFRPFQTVYTVQGPVDQTLDSAITRINHYPADKYEGNQ